MIELLNSPVVSKMFASDCIRLYKPGKWLWVGGLPYALFNQICQQAGQILWTTQVAPRANAPALVVSDKALRLHTDHHRADLIGWYCHAAAASGGETLLFDFEEFYATLDPDLKSTLSRLRFHEHKVFDEDQEWHPFYTEIAGRPRFYFSFWPAPDQIEPEVRAAYDQLRQLVDAQQPLAIRLQPGDALFIDNTQVLHGRTRFTGTDRHLERNWIRLIT